ncbi:hypothetical protein BGZ70_004071, partial [Mortierella alpina]
MQLHGYPATTQHTHLSTEHTPRATPIPGPLPPQSQPHPIQRHPQTFSQSKHQHSIDPTVGLTHPGHPSSLGTPTPITIARQTALDTLDTDIGDRGAGAAETMPIPANFNRRNNSQPDIRPRLNHYHDTSSPVYLHSSSQSHNGSALNLRYTASSSPSSHQAGAMPSPLGGGASSYPGAKGHHSNNMSISSSAALSTFSFLSSSEKSNSVAATESNGKTPSQLRVRHLDQDSSYAGYLT